MIQVNRIYLIFNRLVTKKFLVDTSDVGYQKKTVVVKDKKFISVNLTPDRSMMLDEVVVVGFGKQKKESLVGAVQAVKPEDLKMTSSNLSTSLPGTFQVSSPYKHRVNQALMRRNSIYVVYQLLVRIPHR